MPSQYDALKVGRDTALDQDFFNTRFRILDDRLVSLEGLSISWQAALAVVQDNVLSRSEAVIASLRDQLVSITGLAWLTAGSTSPVSLIEGQDAQLTVNSSDVSLFTPGPYAVISRTANTDFAVVSTTSYDRSTGIWNVHVESVSGLAGGPFSDWQIAAVAGSTLMQKAWLDQGKAARDDAAAAQADVDAKWADVKTMHDEVASMAASTGASAFDSRISTLEGARTTDEQSIALNAAAVAALKSDAWFYQH